MTTLDYEVNVAYNRQRVMEIRDSVRTQEKAREAAEAPRPFIHLRFALGSALIAAGHQVCGSARRCPRPRPTSIARVSS